MRLRKPSPATIIAVAALVVAPGGTAIGASHYIITNTSQIEPSVLRELRADASAAKVAAKGAKAVVARARSVSAVTSTTQPVFTADPLTDGTWKQGAEERISSSENTP
jgi:ornithine cyclodeaminase/alanine dehydrogenase-like protein (mu-crystallin family)